MKLVFTVLCALLLSLIVIPALLALPDVDLSAASVIGSSFFSYIRAGMYFLPMGSVVAILSIQMTLWIFRIIVAVVRTVWDVLPVA